MSVGHDGSGAERVVSKSDDLRLIPPRPHMIGGGDQLPQVVL